MRESRAIRAVYVLLLQPTLPNTLPFSRQSTFLNRKCFLLLLKPPRAAAKAKQKQVREALKSLCPVTGARCLKRKNQLLAASRSLVFPICSTGVPGMKPPETASTLVPAI